MDKDLKRKIIITFIGILALLTIVIGTSYALFSSSASGSKENTIKSGCLKIDMKDEGSITMDGVVPVKDEEGLKNTPYTFTISNECTTNSHYVVTLNVIKGSNLDNVKKIKVSLQGDDTLNPSILSDLEETYLLDYTINDVLKTYKLSTGSLSVNESKSFNLYSWIDYDVESFEGKIKTKVIVNNTAQN